MPGTTRLNDAFALALEESMPKPAGWLLAVSGGLDSMVLLHFLVGAGYRDLIVCHVDHQLRGEASAEDAAFVAASADSLGLEVELAQVEVREHAKVHQCSLELAARELRYASLAAIAKRRGVNRLVTAHHADDQVETVLINFFRGSGARGISGMDPVSERVIADVALTIFRPFLEVSREELERYAEAHRIDFRQDASNFEDFALRNRVRQRLIPELNAIFERDVRRSVLRAAELARRDEAWMSAAQGGLPHKDNGLDVAALRGMPGAQRDRLILAWLRGSGVPDCGFAEVGRVSAMLLSDGRPARVNLPGGAYARRRNGVLFLETEG